MSPQKDFLNISVRSTQTKELEQMKINFISIK